MKRLALAALGALTILALAACSPPLHEESGESLDTYRVGK